MLVAQPVAAVGRCYYSGQHVVRLQPMALFPPLEAQDRASRLRANLCPAKQDIMGCLAPCLECLQCPRHDLQTANFRHALEIQFRIGKAWTSGGAVLRPTQLCRARMPRGCKIHAPQQRSRPGFLHRPSQSASPSPVLTGSEDQVFSRLDHKRRYSRNVLDYPPAISRKRQQILPDVLQMNKWSLEWAGYCIALAFSCILLHGLEFHQLSRPGEIDQRRDS